MVQYHPHWDVLCEVRGLSRSDIGPIDLHEGIAIFASMLVPKSPGMSDLVDDIAGRAIIAQANRLCTHARHPDKGVTNVGRGRVTEDNKLRLGCSRDHAHCPCHDLVPMCNRVSDARLIWHVARD